MEPHARTGQVSRPRLLLGQVGSGCLSLDCKEPIRKPHVNVIGFGYQRIDKGDNYPVMVWCQQLNFGKQGYQIGLA